MYIVIIIDCSTQRVHIYSVVERVDGHLSLSGGQKHFSKPSPHPFPETVEPLLFASPP